MSEKTCVWTNNEDGVAETECGNAFAFDSGDAEENGFKFCCYCGASLVNEKAASIEDED